MFQEDQDDRRPGLHGIDWAAVKANGGSQAVRLPKAYRIASQREVLVHREGRRVKLRRAIRSFVKDVTVVAFDEAAAERFAGVAADLADSGTRIGVLDILVAAQALALGPIVVTNNTRHLGRVAGLKVENWT